VHTGHHRGPRATDARRKEVYWARYDADGRRIEGPLVGPAADIPGARDLTVAGEGGLLYPAAFSTVIEPAYPDARALCAIVATDNHENLLPAEPLYLRRPDARVPGAPKRVTPP
jgi:tRNA threonylcarbamoyladenosine biosynthesis protein TsaB